MVVWADPAFGPSVGLGGTGAEVADCCLGEMLTSKAGVLLDRRARSDAPPEFAESRLPARLPA
eukprot:14175317-Alexandrium_andersonii.AAC.1